MKSSVYFDLDGTLLESRPRLYELFRFLVPSCRFTFDEYWHLKRQRITHRQLLKEFYQYTDLQIDEFEVHWMNRIEDDIWLALDKPFEGIQQYLTKLKQEYHLYLVTARQFEDKTLAQLETFGFLDLFNMVLVTCQKESKSQLINRHLKMDSRDWLIGDTCEDILEGKKLGIRTAGVLSGFISKEKLKSCGPDIIIDKVTNLKFNKILY